MRNIKKTTIYFLIIISLFISVFIGCANNKENMNLDQDKQTDSKSVDKHQSKSESDSKDDASSFEKLLEISWLGLGGQDIQEGNWVQTQLEEKFNVKLKNQKISLHNNEQINLMLNSGEMP